ncbi:MAG: hypothetical protein JO218_10745 [Burkholderiales bacterium]|nr:hypothetical protein [Burkholderiales bacterium]
MRKEYDFSKAERGKFHRTDTEVHLPVYLDQPIQSRLTEIAKDKGIALTELVNALLQKDIELIETAR